MPLTSARDALPWVEKYRPTTLNGIVHHTRIIHLLRRFIATRTMPHLFFYGPPGTGKTTAAKIAAAEAGLPLVYAPLEALMSKWYGKVEKRLRARWRAVWNLA